MSVYSSDEGWILIRTSIRNLYIYIYSALYTYNLKKTYFGRSLYQ